MTLHEYGIASAKGRLRILVGAIAADALVFPDEVIAAQVRSVLAPLGRPKVTRIIPAASSLPASPPDLDRGSFRRRFGLATDALTVGWFGLLTREKGADTLLDALAIARKQRELVLVVVGDVGAQSDAGELAAEVTARGLNNVFTGALSAPDAAAVLASLDVVALPFRDGLTARRTSYLGVRAQGTYIVTTSRERRGYDPGSNTHFVAPGDAPSLAAAILEATQRSRIATSNGSSWAPIVGAHRDLYRSL
jgi:glycosyltransferase involved in cell wall biosynthesis